MVLVPDAQCSAPMLGPNRVLNKSAPTAAMSEALYSKLAQILTIHNLEFQRKVVQSKGRLSTM